MAVIENDIVAVSQILDRHPEAMNEINIYGQSPLHLAATSPRILDILLRTGNQSLLDHRDMSAFTALEIAMIHSSDVCINVQDVRRCHGHQCNCCQCIDLFLDAGCSVRMHKLDQSRRPNAPELSLILANASELARRKYVYHMKISLMAIQSPQPGELSSALTSGVAEDLSWIFNEIADPHLGALFYRQGFKPDPSCLLHLREDHTLRRDTMNFSYLHWLMSHGVDVLSRSPKGSNFLEESPNRGLFGAHFAFHFIELDFPHKKRDNLLARRSNDSWNISMELMKSILRRDLTDGCQCYCTADGCTPFTWMMKGNLFSNRLQDVSLKQRSRQAPYISHYSECGPELTILTYRAAIRFATFTALDISHTCCGAWDSVRNRHEQLHRDTNEINAINEKQANLLKTLEDLLLEFEEKAADYLEPVCKGTQTSFHEFWSTYWVVRINKELFNFHEKKLKEAEEKGAQGSKTHSWGPQRPVEGGYPYKATELKRWLYELDKICPEYSES